MKISVVVCTYNREKYILDSLTSLRDQTFEESLYEIILVDNNSTDTTALKCLEFGQSASHLNYHYYKETKQGLSYARNRGIALAKGEIIVFLDDDAVASKTYLEEIMFFFETHPSVSALGGRIFPKYEVSKPEWMPDVLTPLFSIIDLGDVDKPFRSGKYPIGANMAFRSSVFELCGDFNTELGRTGKNLMGGEEKDLFYRMQQQSLSVWYAAKPWVYHIIPESRMTKEFLKNQALGVGMSEKQRTRFSIEKRMVSYAKECVKWIGSVLYFFFFVLQFQFHKAFIIILFRLWVSTGLLFGNKKSAR
ncbi:MAG: glycosyltransferase [Bacteroidales bacterium]|jgi:glycosyltransferase involved in cell wall biosynthesis|nr:glycosyltransferase [Bacteroidales bacterium]